MKLTKRGPVAVLLLLGAIACGGEAASGKVGVGSGVAAQLETDYGACIGQKAVLPASGAVTQNVVATRMQTSRDSSGAYVSYRVDGTDMYMYLHFAPDLPATFTTAQALAAFRFADIQYYLAQPEGVHGSFTLLSSELTLSDFARLEVDGGLVSFRVVRTSAGGYLKQVSSADLDPSVDPELCKTGDISGMCWCEFSGPPTTVTVDGTFPI